MKKAKRRTFSKIKKKLQKMTTSICFSCNRKQKSLTFKLKQKTLDNGSVWKERDLQHSNALKSEVHNKSNELQPVCNFFVCTKSKCSKKRENEFIEMMRFFCKLRDSRIQNALSYLLYLFLVIVCWMKAYALFTLTQDRIHTREKSVGEWTRWWETRGKFKCNYYAIVCLFKQITIVNGGDSRIKTI